MDAKSTAELQHRNTCPILMGCCLAPRPHSGSQQDKAGTRLRELRGDTSITIEIDIFAGEK